MITNKENCACEGDVGANINQASRRQFEQSSHEVF